MQRKHYLALAAIFGLTLGGAQQVFAQAPAAGASGGRGARGGGRGVVAATPAPGGGGMGSYPARPAADPAVVAAGKALWDASCGKCHASDLRGTPTGINLVRSQMVLDDQHGEIVGKFLQNSHAKGQAAKTDWNADQLLAVATYMHTFQNYRSIVMPPDINGAILAVGNAKAGETYFGAHCASCHSVTGDLKGVGTKYAEPRTLQNALVAGGGGGGRGGRGGADPTAAEAASRRTVTVTVTMPDGKKYEGRQILRDDFLVTLVDQDGVQRTIRRNGDVPKVEVHDPMKAHRDMLLTLQDEDIHNLTAYLVTVK